MKSRAHKNKLDYDYIGDGIYIGTNQCCQFHFDERLKKKEKISADISLEEERIDAPFGVKFYVWLPVKDHSAPSQDQLALGVAAIRRLVALRKRIYVHCKNGHGRAPTLVAAYFASKGVDSHAAVKFIKSKRPAIHLRRPQLDAIAAFARHYSNDKNNHV